MKLGFIGLGRMGMGMAHNLADGGFDLTVYNRTAERAAEFAAATGARHAPTPRELAEQTSVVITMVASGPALIELLDGADGLCAGLEPGDVVIDMGTTGVEFTEAARARVAESGAALVEAPVSGSIASVEAKTLLIMLGGDEDAVRVAEPILEGLADRVVRMGGPGTGAAMKLAVNAVVFGINQAVAESLVLAERAGIDRADAYEIFATSAVGAPVVLYRRAVFENPGEMPVTFTVDLAIKDMELVLELAEGVGASMPQTETNAQVMKDTSSSGRGAADMGDVAVHLREPNE